MKQRSLFTLFLFIFIWSSCERVNYFGNAPVVSQFVYDGMSTVYLWNKEMLAKKPTANDTDPKKYFKTILHKTDVQHGWSWITDDVQALLSDFSGESLSFGYNLGFTVINNTVYAYVRYVYAGTPADKAGLQRLDLIGKLNGQPITTEQRDGNTVVSTKDVSLLYGNNAVQFTVYKFSENQAVKSKELTIAPDNSGKDPVLYDSIYTIGDKKIGYLFYTAFRDNYNDRLYEVFNKFKQAAISDLVLDLRYNTGGAVTSAIYLASLIAPGAVVESKSPFSVMDYNSNLNASFDKWYNEAEPADKHKYDRRDYLGVYDEAKDRNPLEANLDLRKVYVIATGGSYSAAELTPFCLRPYMDVVHIGSETGGKYTASWTMHAYDQLKDSKGRPRANTIYEEKNLSSTKKAELKNWAIQPIVAMYADKDGKNFSHSGHLVPNYKLEEGFGKMAHWAPLGDTKDVLLGQALYLISGDNSYQPVKPASVRSLQADGRKIINPVDDAAQPLIIDQIQLTGEKLYFEYPGKYFD